MLSSSLDERMLYSNDRNIIDSNNIKSVTQLPNFDDLISKSSILASVNKQTEYKSFFSPNNKWPVPPKYLHLFEDPNNGMLEMFKSELKSIEIDIFVSAQPVNLKQDQESFLVNLSRRERLKFRYEFYKCNVELFNDKIMLAHNAFMEKKARGDLKPIKG